MPINYKLLKRIQKAIAKEPRRLEMANGIKIKDRIAPCGTTACIADHAVIYSRSNYPRKGFKGIGTKIVVDDSKDKSWFEDLNEADWVPIRNEAIRVLRLGDLSDSSDRLFFVDHWPDDFNTQYHQAKTRKTRAKVAIARIQRFIDTKGRE